MDSCPDLEPVHCFMSGSYCCFLTCIEVSHEASNVIWYSHLFKNLAQSVVVYTIKGFSVVIKEVNVFLNSLAWTSGISQFTYCWSLAWRMLSITLHSFHMLAVLAESVWYNYFRMLESIETLDFPGEGMDRKLQLILVSFSSQYSSSCPSPNTNSTAGSCACDPGAICTQPGGDRVMKMILTSKCQRSVFWLLIAASDHKVQT